VTSVPTAAVVYLDSSALVKLAIPEPESGALRAELTRWDRFATSAVARAEVVRACIRVDAASERVAEQVVNALDLIAVDDRILVSAARLRPPALRTLEAIHLASALAVGELLAALITYDRRLAEGAVAAGVRTLRPD
jgi:uncharacterized protein